MQWTYTTTYLNVLCVRAEQISVGAPVCNPKYKQRRTALWERQSHGCRNAEEKLCIFSPYMLYVHVHFQSTVKDMNMYRDTTSYLYIKEGYILHTCLSRLNRLRGNSDSHSRPTVGRCLRLHWSAVDKLIRVTSNNRKKMDI